MIERKEQPNTEVFCNLLDFYMNNKDWITKYKEISTNFDTDMVKRDISPNELNSKLEECSVLILTANQVEQNILTRKLYKEMNRNEESKREMSEISIGSYVYQFSTVSRINIVHLHPHTQSAFTEGGAANAVRDTLERFRPKLVVSLGVAFGIRPNEQKLGDVLISREIIPYDIYNKDVDGNIKLRSRDTYFTHEAINAWDVLMQNEKFSLEREASERYSLIDRKLEFKWQYGALLSGGSVLSNEDKKHALLRAAEKEGNRDVIGGEMEGIGVYYECKKPNIPCVVIKGICDWAAEKNSWGKIIDFVNEQEDKKQRNKELVTNDVIKDCVQGYAMDNAVESLLRFLRFDSKFLESYYPAQINNIYCKFSGVEKVWKKIKLYEKRILRILERGFVLFLALCIINKFLSNYMLISIVKIPTIIYVIEVICIILIIIMHKAFFLYPMETHNRWINFSFFKEEFKGCFMQVLLKDSRPIFNVTISWWMRNGRVKQDFKEVGNIKGNTFVKVAMPDSFSYKMILQISYEMASGEQYVHLISGKWCQKFRSLEKRREIIYSERIYRIEGNKTGLIGIQNGVLGEYEIAGSF